MSLGASRLDSVLPSSLAFVLCTGSVRFVLQDLHWSDLMNSWDKEKKAEMSPSELKRREAVWELFKSECVFLIDHLMVLKHVSFAFTTTLPLTLNLMLGRLR